MLETSWCLFQMEDWRRFAHWMWSILIWRRERGGGKKGKTGGEKDWRREGPISATSDQTEIISELSQVIPWIFSKHFSISLLNRQLCEKRAHAILSTHLPSTRRNNIHRATPRRLNQILRSDFKGWSLKVGKGGKPESSLPNADLVVFLSAHPKKVAFKFALSFLPSWWYFTSRVVSCD